MTFAILVCLVCADPFDNVRIYAPRGVEVLSLDAPLRAAVATLAQGPSSIDGIPDGGYPRPRVVETFTPIADAVAAIGPDTFTIAQPVLSDRWTGEEKLQLGLGLFSVSAASVASSLTFACIYAEECRETARLMRRLFSAGRVGAAVGQAAITAGIHYVVVRFTKGRWRTIGLASQAVINGWDAIHDIRVTRRIEAKARKQ